MFWAIKNLLITGFSFEMNSETEKFEKSFLLQKWAASIGQRDKSFFDLGLRPGAIVYSNIIGCYNWHDSKCFHYKNGHREFFSLIGQNIKLWIKVFNLNVFGQQGLQLVIWNNGVSSHVIRTDPCLVNLIKFS